MGLDWNPLGKPKPSLEVEFERVFKLLGELPVNVGLFEKLRRRLKGIDRKAIDERWRELQVTPYETLKAPQVGISDAANQWALQRYAEIKDPKPPEEEFFEEMQGYYVLDLVPPCDGIPWYSNGSLGYVEKFSFRAQFLLDCEHVIGNETLEKCYVSCLAPGLVELGRELRAGADSYSMREGVAHVEQVAQPNFEEGTAESNAHILFAAARWCEFWSSRGHGLDAYW